MTRSDVFDAAQCDISTDDNACRLLWYSLVWGAGPSRRRCTKRMKAVREGLSDVAEGLVMAASLSATDPGAAYGTVCPSTSQYLVKFLGPAFATKFPYFAGAGAERHPCLILDRLVATALRDRCG